MVLHASASVAKTSIGVPQNSDATEATAFAEVDLVKVPGSLKASINGRCHGDVGLWHMHGRSSEFAMAPHPDREPAVSFVFVESGLVSARAPGSAWNALEAPLIVMPTVPSRRIRLRGSWRITVVRMPLRAMDAFVPMVPSEVGVFHHTRVLDQAMHQFVSTVLQTNSHSSAIETQAIEQLVIEMAGAVLLDRVGPQWGHGNPHSALRDRALAVIAHHSADPQLTPAKVAQHAQASLRHLQAVLADSGTSIATEIRRARARAAHLMLSDSRFDALSIDHIAERAGFSTTASLRRATEEIYQHSPRTVRESRSA